MKARAIFIVFSLVGAVVADVQRGASLAEVQAILGTPSGEAQLNGRQLLYFDRGMVELQEGRVTKVALRTAEEQAAFVAREERAQVERESQRAQLVAEGISLRDRKAADVSFQAAPVAHQVAFWEDFARRYPGVSVAEPLSIARLRLNEQLAEKRLRDEERRRLDEIEQRLAAAEREPVHYRVRSYPTYYGRHHRYREFGLGPITYTFYDAPLPAYTTPTTPLITPLVGDPAQPLRRDYPGFRSEHGKGHERDRGWRGFERKHDRRDRM